MDGTDAYRPSGVAAESSTSPDPAAAASASTAPEGSEQNHFPVNQSLAEGCNLQQRSIASITEMGRLLLVRTGVARGCVQSIRSLHGRVTNPGEAQLVVPQIQHLKSTLDTLASDLRNYSVILGGGRAQPAIGASSCHAGVDLVPPNPADIPGYMQRWEQGRRLGAEAALLQLRAAKDRLQNELTEDDFAQDRLDTAIDDLGRKFDELDGQVSVLVQGIEEAAGRARRRITPEVVRNAIAALPESSTTRWLAVSNGLMKLNSIGAHLLSFAASVGRLPFSIALNVFDFTYQPLETLANHILALLSRLMISDSEERREEEHRLLKSLQEKPFYGLLPSRRVSGAPEQEMSEEEGEIATEPGSPELFESADEVSSVTSSSTESSETSEESDTESLSEESLTDNISLDEEDSDDGSNSSFSLNTEPRVELQSFVRRVQQAEQEVSWPAPLGHSIPTRIPGIVAGSREERLLITLAEQPEKLAATVSFEYQQGRDLHRFERYWLPRLWQHLTADQFHTLCTVIKAEKSRAMDAEAGRIARAAFDRRFHGQIRPDDLHAGQKIDANKYVEKLQIELAREQERLQKALKEAFKRSSYSGGQDYQAQLQ